MGKRSYGTGSLEPRSEGSWRLKYYVPGEAKPRRETIHAATRKEAEKELRARLKLVDDQRIGGKAPMHRLFEMHLADLTRHGRDASIPRMRVIKHLEERFGPKPAAALTLTDLNNYIDARLAVKAAKGTINRELSIIQRSLQLGVEHGLISVAIAVEKLDESDNVRQGFIEREIYLSILRELPAHQQMLFCFAYHLGIRKGELLKFHWEWLLPYWNEPKPVMKVPGEACKNKKPHTIPIYRDMVAFVSMAIAERDPNCPYLFQYRGRRLKNIRSGWEAARERAGVPKVLFHDMRRTAIRNMERAGIPRSDARQITGHRTEATYLRYDISSERGAIEVGTKMAEFHQKQLGSKLGPSENDQNVKPN